MIFWLILVASLIMRCVLIRSGGLFFNPDEFRYYRAINFLHHLKSGEVKEALAMFFIYAEHSGYMLVATIPAAVQGVLDAAFGRSPERSMAVAAIILSLFSVGNIALVYGIARRTGRSKREALVAMGLMAASGAMLHTSRHLLPYDVSLFFGLLAIWLVHGRRSLLATFGMGLCVFMVFMSYNAYWILAGLVGVYAGIQLLMDPERRWKTLPVLAGGALLLPIAQMVLASSMGYSYLQSLKNFSATITQGTWSEGWWIGWAYLWHAEHVLLLVWLVGVAWLCRCRRERSSFYWIGFVVATYLLLVLGSVVFHTFVVYGRSMRPMIPFICLLAAGGLISMRPRWRTGLLVIVGLQALWHFSVFLQQRFPGDVLLEAKEFYKDDLSVALAVTGPALHVEDYLLGPSPFVLVNHRVLTPVTGTNAVPAGKVIFSTPHPFQSKLYQYNGLGAEERRIIDSSDQSIRIIDTE